MITLDPTGNGDYTTLQGADDGAEVGDTVWSALSGGDLGTATINNANPPSIEFLAAVGHRHDGTDAGDTVAYCKGSAFGSTRLMRDNVRVRWMRFSTATGSVMNSDFSTAYSISSQIVESCMFANAVNLQMYSRHASATGVIVRNNILYGNGITVGASAPIGGSDTINLTALVLNNTAHKAAAFGAMFNVNVSAFDAGDNCTLNVTWKNNFGGGSSSGCYTSLTSGSGTKTINLTSANNASTDGTADDFGGAGHLVNQTAADWFENATSNLRLKAGAPGIDVGATLAEVSEDILGTARPQGDAFDIGAFEFVPAVVSGRSSFRSAVGLGI